MRLDQPTALFRSSCSHPLRARRRFAGARPDGRNRPEPATQLDHVDFRTAAVRTRRKTTRSAPLHSIWKPQLPLDRLEARLLAQRVHEGIGSYVYQAWVTRPQRRLEPFECLRPITPLRLDRRVLIGWGVAEVCRQFRKLGFRIRVPAELFRVTCDCLRWSQIPRTKQRPKRPNLRREAISDFLKTCAIK